MKYYYKLYINTIKIKIRLNKSDKKELNKYINKYINKVQISR